MSLRVKLLLALYLAVGLVWFAHTVWQLRRFEKAFIEAEVRASLELGTGIRHHLRHLSTHHRGENQLQENLEGFDRDVMVINSDLVVVAASDPARLGRTWSEPGILAVMGGESSYAYNDHEHDGRRVLDVSIALETARGERAYVLHVARPQEDLQVELAGQRRDHLFMLIVAFAVMTMLVTAFTHRMILEPLTRIQARIGASPWRATAKGGTIRDLHGLEQVVRAMLERIDEDRRALNDAVADKSRLLEELQGMKGALEVEVDRVREELRAAEKSLLRSERHAALGQLSGALAHELRNPLHIVRGLAETAGRRQPEVAPFTDDIQAEVDRIDQLIKELLQYTRPLDLEVQDIDAGELLESVRDRVARVRRQRGQEPCHIELISRSSVVYCDPMLLEQSLENLIGNACDAAGPDGTVSVGEAVHGDCAVVTVRDTGPGIAEEDMASVLEPFFTRKAGGTGLGLCIAQRIVELHGGELVLANHPDGGLEVTVRLPQPHGVTDG